MFKSTISFQGLAQTVHKPHLRNIFFRVLTFYRLGANLVFVIDGEATRLKWATMDQRERRREGQEEGRGVGRMTGRRPHLQRYVTEVGQNVYRHTFCMYIHVV